MQAISSSNSSRPYWRSSSFKIALLFALMLGLCVAILVYLCINLNRDAVRATAAQALDMQISYLGTDPEDLKNHLTGSKSPLSLAGLYSPDGVLISALTENAPPFITTTQITPSQQWLNSRIFIMRTSQLSNGDIWLVGMDVTSAMGQAAHMRFLSYISIAVVSCVILISFLISAFVVTRTNRIATIARTIMLTGDLSQRIEVDSNWDDLSHMAGVLNALLNRIEDLMIGVRRVSDNIAHDLRTPLSRLQNTLERLMLIEQIAQNNDASMLCETAHHDVERLLAIFNGLLRIARVETGELRQHFKTVDLTEILADVLDFYEPWAARKNICLSLKTEPPLKISGDRDLLFQACANLIDNAVKFSPSGGAVDIDARALENTVQIDIRDTGPGIAPEHRDKVFDRFYRADSARLSEGYGLGLTMVAAVVDLHLGRIQICDSDTGLHMRLTLFRS